MDDPAAGPSRREMVIDRLKRGLDHLWRLVSNGLSNFSSHRGTQMAASMGYYTLFSVFPTVIVMAAAAGFILDDAGARQEVVDFLLDELPLSDAQGKDDIESLLDGVTANAGTLGLIGVATLLVSASALISVTRNSVSVIFGEELRRGAIRGKALDVLLVIGLGVLFTISFAATLLRQLDLTLNGRIGDAIEVVLNATGSLLPIALTAIVFATLYRVLPTSRPGLRTIWPGVLFATLGYEVLKSGFSIYLENFSNYSAVYGSLGAVIAFMFFVWLASIVFLIGAEFAAIWPGVKRGDFDPDPDEEGTPFRETVRSFVLGLFRRRRADI